METIGAVRLEERKRQFMTAVDFSDQRQRRETFAVELRRQKRNENAQKRRLLSSNTYSIHTGEDAGPLILEEIPVQLQAAYPSLRDLTVSDLDRAAVLKTVLQTPALDPNVYFCALSVLRKALSRDSFPPIRAVTRLGFVPVFLSFINLSQYPAELIYEATWAICNIVSGAHDTTEAVVNAGGIPLLIHVIDPAEANLSEHAIWALGNIAGDCDTYRELVLNSRAHEAVVSFILRSEHIATIHARTIAWTIATFVRGRKATLNVCEELIKGLGQLSEYDDLEVQKDVLWALAHISDGDNDFTQLVINAGLGKHASRYVASQEPILVNPAVRVLGNIASGDDLQTQYALDLGLLDKAEAVISAEDKTVRKEVVWTLSNVTAGTKDQIQAFLNHRVSRVAMKMFEDPEVAVRKEASWIFNNIAKKGKTEQKLMLVDMGLLSYVKLTFLEDSEIVLRSLETVYELLAAGMEFRLQQNLALSPSAEKLEESGCLQALEQLQAHKNPQVASLALRIVAEFFGFEDGAAPSREVLSPHSGFTF